MTEIHVTDQAVKYIDNLIETADKEKAAIADALTTASDAKFEPITDSEDFINICEVLGRYNKLLTLITNC